MTRSYLVLRDGLLYTRCLTLIKAKEIVATLHSQGFRGSIAYDITGGN